MFDLFFGKHRECLFHIRIVNFTNIASGLTSDFITSITADEDGDVWFGSEFGLGFLPTEDLDEFDAETANAITATMLTSQDGLPSSQITTVRALGNKIFVGTCEGLTLLTKEKRSECVIIDGVNIGTEDGLPSESVRSMRSGARSLLMPGWTSHASLNDPRCSMS